MSFRKYLSGSQKRQKKVNMEIRTKKMKGSIEKFVFMNDLVENNEIDVNNETCTVEASSSFHKEINDNRTSIETSGDSRIAKENTLVLNCSESEFSDDPALWPTVVTDEMREYFLIHKPDQFLSEIDKSKRFCSNKERVLTEYNFYRFKKNNEKTKRDWLIFSPSKKVVFCYICKLFSANRQALSDEGYGNWKNVSERLSEHENSKTHRDAVCTFSLRLMSQTNLKSQMIDDYEKESNYWRSVLCRVVATIKFLAERGLPIFGDNETLGSLQNGNYLGCLEYLAKFDPFIKEHLEKYGNGGKGNTNYLSSTIATEILYLMSNRVQKEILQEVLNAKYFGLIVDSTPDMAHIDQLSLILRYVDQEGVPVERFIKFIQLDNHSSSCLASTVFAELENLGLDIMNCRGQSYDNASNMAGKYSGLQARIKDVCPLAEYIPCSAHSLNLVGTNAVHSCNQAVSFFGIVQTLYNFFSCSTHRWQILQKKLLAGSEKLVIKSLSSTRWSAEADATRALRKGYILIRNLLYNISEDENESPTTRLEARNLHSKFSKFETALLAVIWDTILQRINMVHKTLQHSTGDLSSLLPLYESLIDFVHSVRNEFDTYETEALTLVEKNVTYCIQRKKNISKRLDDAPQNESILSPKEYFKFMCHNVICDTLVTQLKIRMEAYKKIHERFGFLYNLKLSFATPEIKKLTENFHAIYSGDIDDSFSDEFAQFQSFFKEYMSPNDCLKEIRRLNISHTFPNVEVAYRLLLTLPITNCSSERSFSVLKRIKNRLRTALSQNSLQAFSLLTIENDITAKLDFNDIINDFASIKARKKPL